MVLTSAPEQSPPTPRRPRAGRRVMVLVALVAVALVVAQLSGAFHTTVNGSGTTAGAVYGPQPDRNAEWVGPYKGFSSDEIHELANNVGIELLPKFADGYDLAKHFQNVRDLETAAETAGHHIDIYDYFSASFRIPKYVAGWGKYGAGFQQSWLLKDSRGKTVPFYGTGKAASTSSSDHTPYGYMVDLSNPDYRTWAVKTIVSWMHQAPYAGIVFDAANQMLAGASRASLGNGVRMNFNQILCGSDVVQLNCKRVTAWNAGLHDLLRETSDALHDIGDKVIYNGIAPAQLRGPTRNIGLLADADMTTNESFCLSPAIAKPDNVQFMSFDDDLKIMLTVAAEHKKVIQIVNYQTPHKAAYGDYCLAGFLMGWQPGSSYFVFHSNYGDAFSGGYPTVPEQNLELGDPSRPTYSKSGPVLSRSFDNGFVAVNDSDNPAKVKVPESGMRFTDGSPDGQVSAGDTVTLGPRQALYLMSSSYLAAHHCIDASGNFDGC